MKITKTHFLASASAMVLGLSMASPAQAFESVDWNWDKQITSVENITIGVEDTFDWSGLVQVEKIQTNIGDVTATSNVSGIANNPPGGGEGGGVVTIDETFVFQTFYDDTQDPDAIVPTGMVAGTPDGLNGEVLSGAVNEGDDVISDLTFHVTGEFEVEDLEASVQDALDLPAVVSAATAVANNQAIDSTSAINLHDAQFNFGGFSAETAPDLEAVFAAADQTDNPHTDAALGLTLAAALGILTPGTVSATSTVSEILNASVDSTATAVGNNISVNIEPLSEGDATMLADLTQFNYADVTALSSVTNVALNDYSNLAILDGALVSSVATAVGNNVSISVGNFAVGE